MLVREEVEVGRAASKRSRALSHSDGPSVGLASRYQLGFSYNATSKYVNIYINGAVNATGTVRCPIYSTLG